MEFFFLSNSRIELRLKWEMSDWMFYEVKSICHIWMVIQTFHHAMDFNATFVLLTLAALKDPLLLGYEMFYSRRMNHHLKLYSKLMQFYSFYLIGFQFEWNLQFDLKVFDIFSEYHHAENHKWSEIMFKKICTSMNHPKWLVIFLMAIRKHFSVAFFLFVINCFEVVAFHWKDTTVVWEKGHFFSFFLNYEDKSNYSKK